MARISSSISGLERTLLRQLDKANAGIAVSTLRKSTGHKINSPADDVSGFMALSMLQSQLGQTNAALKNATAANSMVSQTQTTLSAVTTQLSAIRGLLVDDSITPAQAQQQIDLAIDQISRLSQTEINGKRLFDGSADFRIEGVQSDQVESIQVISPGIGPRTIHADVTVTASQAELTYQGTAADEIEFAAEFRVNGSEAITVSAGQSLTSAAEAINAQSDATRVVATVDTTNHTLVFTSVDYGTTAEATIAVDEGVFVTSGSNFGTNATAQINGVSYTGNGNTFDVNQNGFHFEIEFAAGFTGTTNRMSVTGDAMSFALSTNIGQRSTLAIPGMQPAKLGGPSGTVNQLATGGSLSGLGANKAQAVRVIDEAISQVLMVEANAAGFMNSTIDSAETLLSGLQTELTYAIDDIDGVDDEEEDTLIAHFSALASNSIVGLQILNQQRQMVVTMIQNIAGLNN